MDRPSLRQLSLHSGSEGPREVDPFQMYLYLWTRCVGLPDGTTHEAEGLSVRDRVPIKHEYHDISHDFPNEPSFPESILTREEPNNIRNYPIVKQEAERDCNGYYQLPRGSHNATYGLERFTAMEQVRDLNQHSMNEQWGGYDYGSSAGAEPMSGSEDYGEYYGRGTDNNPKREQKRRPKPKDGTQLICGVCGDKALGYNFDAITCESCKAFFRRNANKTKVFTCSFDGNCKLDTHTRKFCSGCRLKKCFQIGMKKDWILSEEQLAKRRQKGPKPNGPKQRRLDDPRDESMDMPMSSAEATSSNDVMSSTEVSTSYQSDDSTRSPVDSFSSMKSETEEDDFPRPLREDYRLEIENLEHQYAAVFDVPYNEDQFTKLANNPRTPNELFNLTDIFIRRLIKFAKHVPEFKNLQQEDQIHLLKGGIMEIMVLRSAMGFDSKNMAWNVKGASQNTLKEMKLSPDMIKAVDSGIYMEHVRFVMSLNELTRANKTILTLLFVIELFSSDRPSLKNKELVSKGQEKFSAWLKAYLESIYPLSEARQLYPRLLIKLLDVRSLGESSAQLASHLDITRLEPLLVEIFSLQK